MIDTVKLVIAYSQRPEWLNGLETTFKRNVNTGGVTVIINPNKGYKVAGIYQPRLTYHEQPSREGVQRKLRIELSLPKLMFGNNFSELTDADFDVVAIKLSAVLHNTYSIEVSPNALAASDVSKIDYSKNIIFADYTPISSITNSMRTADIAKTYDVQKTNYKNGGHIYHIHTNSLDVAMYDKIADLKKEKVSEKRSAEKDGYIQMDLLDSLEADKSVSVARFEVRLNSVRKIRSELKAAGFFGGTTFRELFSTTISGKILLSHWTQVFTKIPKVSLDSDNATNLFISIAKANRTLTYTQAMAAAHYQTMLMDHDERYVRSLAEGLFSPSQYRRFKLKSREPPPASQLKTLIEVTKTLKEMKPVSIVDYC